MYPIVSKAMMKKTAWDEIKFKRKGPNSDMVKKKKIYEPGDRSHSMLRVINFLLYGSSHEKLYMIVQ